MFPVITQLADVLPSIEGRPEFIVSDKGAYIVVNFVITAEDTFEDPNEDGISAAESHARLIRRECRGLIFDGATKQLIRRPYHKFFNINQNEQVQVNNVDLYKPHVVMDKLDGSMIVPFRTSDGVLRVGTKMGETDVSAQCASWFDYPSKYHKFTEFLLGVGFNPIFEWCSPKQQIILNYKSDQLVLTAVRYIRDGHYLRYDNMRRIAEMYDIPVVQTLNLHHLGLYNADQLTQWVSKREDLEGYVVRFDSGEMVKLKCEWYVALHRSKDAIQLEKNVCQMILNNQLDDLLPFLVGDDIDRVNKYNNQLMTQIAEETEFVATSVHQVVRSVSSRKDFALNHADKFDVYQSMIFRNFELFQNSEAASEHKHIVFQEICKILLKECGSGPRLDKAKSRLRINVEWNSAYLDN